MLVIVPGVITVWVLHWIVGLLDQTLYILPASWQPAHLLGTHIPGFGVLLTLAILLVVGAVASRDWLHSSYGRKIMRAVELRDSGRTVGIIGEDHWRRFL